MKQFLKKFFTKKIKNTKILAGETELDYIPMDEIKNKLKTKKLKKNK